MKDKGKQKKLKRSILIVDDVPKNLQVLVNMLREKDYKISVATDGKKAMDMLKRFLPDLVLLDIMMPHMDGFEVCKALKSDSRTKGIPVIFLSAKTEAEDIVKGFSLGAVDYVTKPFNKAELLARVKTHLELKKAHKEIVDLEKKNAVMAMAVTANHEINQPLTVLRGNFEIYQRSINRENLDDSQKRSLIRMEESVERIRNILKTFGEFESINFENYVEDRDMVVFNAPGSGKK
ncbi:MAG: response regulator [bacterium]|nr:response regulator [bacterium]